MTNHLANKQAKTKIYKNGGTTRAKKKKKADKNFVLYLNKTTSKRVQLTRTTQNILYLNKHLEFLCCCCCFFSVLLFILLLLTFSRYGLFFRLACDPVVFVYVFFFVLSSLLSFRFER